jgi:hypothetical protein
MKETVEQFLARGGVISKLEPAARAEVKQTISSTTYVNNIYPLDEGALYFADKPISRKTKVKVKSNKPPKRKVPKLNLSLLPPDLVTLISQTEESTHEEASQSQIFRERE